MDIEEFERYKRIRDVSDSLKAARAFFAANKDGGELAKKIQGLSYSEQLDWEQFSVCAESPGPVKDEEMLVRQILNPVHFDIEADEVKPNLFEDVISKGASTHRSNHCSEEMILNIALDRVAVQNVNPPKTGLRTLIGYVSISALAVRNLSVDVDSLRDKRVLAVYDTANKKDSSHTDICLLQRQKQAELSVKSQLYLHAKGTLKRTDRPLS